MRSVLPAGTLLHRSDFVFHSFRLIRIVLFLTFLPMAPAVAGTATTPLAGQPYHTEILGQTIHVPSRDRREVTAVNLGVNWIPEGPSRLKLLPLGALFVWRNWEETNRRFRGTLTGVFNELSYHHGLTSASPWFLALTVDSVILPLGRSEYVENQRIKNVDLEWSYAFAGIGVGYRTPLSPWHQDNAFEASLTYEPGYRWFDRSSATSESFRMPRNTYEGRVRARLRVDRFERNLMELLHAGMAVGGDVVYGHRAKWGPWGGDDFPRPDADEERTYMLASVYAAFAEKIPGLSGRHRWTATFHGGIGKDADRFSTFRLPGRPTGYEWEALSRPLLPGVAFNEFFPRKYAIANLTYRYEALFFLFPYIRGTWSVVERPRFRDDGTIDNRRDILPAIGGGVVSGAPWRSQIEINYSYNFGVFRGDDPEKGGHGLMLFWSKLL